MIASVLAFMSLLLVLTILGVISYTKDIINKTNSDSLSIKLKNFCFAVCLGLILISSIVTTLVYEYTKEKEFKELIR